MPPDAQPEPCDERPPVFDRQLDLYDENGRHAGAPVVGVSGELDMAAAARARAAVWDAICRHGYRQLVLDVTGVEFLGSHGLQVLVDTAAVTTQGGHGLLRVGVGRRKRVLRPIQLAGLDAVLACSARKHRERNCRSRE